MSLVLRSVEEDPASTYAFKEGIGMGISKFLVAYRPKDRFLEDVFQLKLRQLPVPVSSSCGYCPPAVAPSSKATKSRRPRWIRPYHQGAKMPSIREEK